MQKLFKVSAIFVVTMFFMAPVFALVAMPAKAELDPWGGKEEDIQSTTGLGEKDPRDIAAAVINVILGFLGIVAVIIILLGGFKWMTAAGNEDKVGEAKKLITAGIIGLVIILAAFAIAKFVLTQLMSATTG